jgi:phosphoserine phosphatase
MSRPSKETYDLSDAEKRDLIELIQQGKALPEKYRFILFEDKREVELVWNGKTRDVCAQPHARSQGHASADQALDRLGGRLGGGLRRHEPQADHQGACGCRARCHALTPALSRQRERERQPVRAALERRPYLRERMAELSHAAQHIRARDAMTATEFAPGLFIRGLRLPLHLADYKLVAFDMDSTMINIECVDEIAALAGRGAEVAAITEAAMRGGSTQAPAPRGAAGGLPEVTLQQVYDERLQLNPGVQVFVRACQAAGLKTLLISGGFTFFSERIRQHLKLDFARANTLGVFNGRLTGTLFDRPWGDIVDGAEKKRVLLEVCELMGISTEQAIAVGDGANPADDAGGGAVDRLPSETGGARHGVDLDHARRHGPGPRDPALSAGRRARAQRGGAGSSFGLPGPRPPSARAPR